MPATSRKQVYNFADNFERATQSILDAGGLTAAYIRGDARILPPSRQEITFERGQTLNEAVLLNGDHVYDFFNGTLTIRIVTVRPQDQPSLLDGVSKLHNEYAATVLTLLEERMAPYTTDNLPYYAVKRIMPMPEKRDFDPQWFEDYTELPFMIEFGIRPDAWPT